MSSAQPNVTRIEPEFKISTLKDGSVVEVIPKSEFWTSVVIVIIVLASIPYLAYTVFKYYNTMKHYIDKFPGEVPAKDKETYQDMWIGAIVIVVLLSIATIIFISFYFKNYTKRAFAQDNISIKEAFQKISRELAQHAADEYSDEQVNNHMEDMATLGGRIMAAKQGDDWYSDPKEFRQNYDEIPGEGYRRFRRKNPPEYTGPAPSAPATVQAAINQPPVDLLGGSIPQGGQAPMKPQPVARPRGPVQNFTNEGPTREAVKEQFGEGFFSSPMYHRY